MKVLNIATSLAVLASAAYAAPTLKARQFEAQITYHGATPEDSVTQSVPTDGTIFEVCK